MLLRDVKKTQDSGVAKSCTIEIGSTLVKGGKRVCLVDGGVWTGCNVSDLHDDTVRCGADLRQDGHTAADFVRVIEAEWANLQSGVEEDER